VIGAQLPNDTHWTRYSKDLSTSSQQSQGKGAIKSCTITVL